MKFLVFTDLHENKKQLKELVSRAEKDDVDFVISLGDISNFGRGLKNVLNAFNKVGKPFYVIPGNHEESGTMLDDAVKPFSHVENLHCKDKEVGSYVFLGYGGGGFAQEDKMFRKVARDWYGRHKGKKIVLLTHGPPFGCNLDLLHEKHVGNKDYQKFIERVEPKLVLCGHLHETAGQSQKIGKMLLINPGWEGKVVELK
ncbi:hypothetical protein COV20_04195 [Candidatus Woesearchaeota archaeon CG10_big_fil_rev_8_21_14_0_10_45_16]|nr:MAG: hypothetical protein COV20_04195 [Candidatus Woesearchaeota archaeon CG10_big_fil_rev_8_21_14_0_10_45_16]